MEVFFQENIFASYIVAILIIVAFGVFIFFRIKETLDSLDNRLPQLGFYNHLPNGDNKYMRVFLPFILFVSFIVFSWFLTTLYS